MQHSYKSTSGDHAADETATAYQTESSAWFFLNAAIVTAPQQVDTVATLGDSITSSVGTTIDTNRRWPDILADRYSTLPEHRRLAISNEGISGNRVLGDGAGVSALARFDRDVLSQAGVKWVMILEGINDISGGTRGGQNTITADDLIGAMRQMIDRAHTHGMKVIGCTLTPAGNSSDAGEAIRTALNTWIRTGRAFDAVVDFDAATRDASNPRQFAAGFNNGDRLHPNDAGYKAMADAVDLSIFTRK